MSTPINDFQDILDALERNPALAKELRRHILTDELLHVPAALLAFTEEQRTFNNEQRKFNEAIVSQMADMTSLMASMTSQMADMRSETSRLTSRVTNVETRLTRMDGDFGTIKGYYARNTAAEDAADIAETMGVTLIRTLSRDDLRDMVRGHSMAMQTRHSFQRADLVMETATPGGETRFIAVEISYTADQRDSDRAMRNASIISDVTGKTTMAAVASVRNTREVQALVDSEALYWHPLEDRTPEAE